MSYQIGLARLKWVRKCLMTDHYYELCDSAASYINKQSIKSIAKYTL